MFIFQRNSPKLEPTSVNKTLIDNSINIYVDTQTLLQRLPQFMQLVEAKILIENKSILSQSLKISEQTLCTTRDKIKECVVNELYDYYNILLKQVSDIPRLYRKTNRSVPTKPCTYIDVISKSLLEFNKDASKRLDNVFLVELFEALFNTMTAS